jgi:hypothetical protein
MGTKRVSRAQRLRRSVGLVVSLDSLGLTVWSVAECEKEPIMRIKLVAISSDNFRVEFIKDGEWTDCDDLPVSGLHW